MNVILYKYLFHDLSKWNSEKNITDILIEMIDDEISSLQTILFSSYLFKLVKETLPLFPKKNIRVNPLKKMTTKITLFHSFIWNHPFLSDSLKEEFLDFFSKLQRTYYGFSRFLRIYKFRKATIAVSTDLFLNPLDPKNKRTCIFFIHKSIYYFNISDIWQLLERGWTNHTNFEFDLYMAKNPYTNIPFTKPELYHYYFYRKHGGYSIPTLLEYMFQEHFDLTTFEMKYEGVICKYMIKKTVFNNNMSGSNSNALYYNIIAMLHENRYTTLWMIDPDFPRERLIEIMRPYVYVYYLVTYGKLTENQDLYYSSFLHNSLYLFWKFNPRFGNKKFLVSSSSIGVGKVQPVSFFDKHLLIHTLHL